MASKISQIALVTMLAGLSAIAYCYYFDLQTYSFRRASHVPGWFAMSVPIALAIAAGIAAALMPRLRKGLALSFSATLLFYVVFELGDVWIDWLRQLPLADRGRYLLLFGPGGGIVGQLPRALTMIILGHLLYRMSLREQWGGRLRFSFRDVRVGGLVGLIQSLSIIALGIAFISSSLGGGATLGWFPNPDRDFVNLFSNLYEEILFRGLLLQLICLHLGNKTGIVWTSIMFGLGHGVNPHALACAICGAANAWAILRTKSLWTGWVAHQLSDMLLDLVIGMPN